MRNSLLAIPKSEKFNEYILNMNYHNNNSQIIAEDIIFNDDKKIYLGDKTNKVCRFCGRDSKLTTFKKIAHAFPESIGNKNLFSHYECDECNLFFGTTMEDSYAKFFHFFHLFSRVRGKSGVPKIKKLNDSKLKSAFWSQNNRLEITYSNKENFDKDINNRTINISTIVDTFIPIEVYKSLVKMMLSVLPNNYLPLFSKTIIWLMQKKHDSFYHGNRPLYIKSAFIPNNLIQNSIYYKIFKTKRIDNIDIYFFQLIYGKSILMIELPTSQEEYPLDLMNVPFWFEPLFENKETYFFFNLKNIHSQNFMHTEKFKNNSQNINISFNSYKIL